MIDPKLREPDAAVWPTVDPAPLVLNYQPRPADAPPEPASLKTVEKLALAGGWDVRTGYSLALLRGVANSTYRLTDAYGVWLGAGHPSGWRASAVYSRYTDKSALHIFTGSDIVPMTGTAAGVPGTWSWSSVTIFSGFTRHQVSITDLKEFLKVRGSVLPAWFTAIAEREAGKKEAAKIAAKNRPKPQKEGAN